MGLFSKRWKDLSIPTRMQVVVGIMVVLIIGELTTLRFAMDTLSALRATVAAEGIWSKEQKEAAFSLQWYVLTHNERDFHAFLKHLEVPLGFLRGGLAPEDIDPMVRLLTRTRGISFLDRALRIWEEGDALLSELEAAGRDYHELVGGSTGDPVRAERLLLKVRELNQKLSSKEDEFAKVLGEGSRWLEGLIIKLLIIAALTVGAIGVTLNYVTSREISRGLREISEVARAIGREDFDRKAEVDARDEIGLLAASVNRMGSMLQRSYSELELRVEDRTRELAEAVRVRDAFLSIASHELKTPLTSLKLQTQIRKRELTTRGASKFTEEKILRMFEDDDRQIGRLVRLVDEMLDVALLRSGKFNLKVEEFDLCELVQQVIDRFQPEIRDAGYTLDLDLGGPVRGKWDHFRLEQVLTNLITNAIKYGGRKEDIHVKVSAANGRARLVVRDRGIGIAREDQARIFHLFERASTARNFGGLGLGLFIAREIVDAHGGTLTVESQPDRGSTFVVQLSCFEPAEPMPRAESA